MRFENTTPLSAALVPNAERDESLRALVVCALSCDIVDRGLVVAVEQPPLLTDPRLPYPNDVFFLRQEAIGVCATGFVYPARIGDGTAHARLTVGDRTTRVAAFGARQWRRGVAGLAATRPDPFERIEMTWTNAYGGKVARPTSYLKFEGEQGILPAHDASFPLNADGTGFYLNEEQALGSPLCALEDPDYPIGRWDDYPEPVCLAPYPLQGGLRAAFVLVDGKVDRSQLGRLASRAGPRTTFRKIDVGTRIELEGMRPKGELLAFAVPPSPVALDIEVGPHREPRALSLDCVDIDAEARRVRFVFRDVFGYDLIQHDLRTARLVPHPDVELAPGATLEV